MTEIELAKLLSKSPYKDILWVETPYNSIMPFRGFYSLQEAEGPYFYGTDKVGFQLRAHYTYLKVKDYKGTYRNIITCDLEGQSYDLLLQGDTRKTSDQEYDLLKVLPRNIIPGDLYQEDEGDSYELILKIYDSPDKGLKLLLDSNTMGFETITVNNLNSLEDCIYTLVDLHP